MDEKLFELHSQEEDIVQHRLRWLSDYFLALNPSEEESPFWYEVLFAKTLELSQLYDYLIQNDLIPYEGKLRKELLQEIQSPPTISEDNK